MAFFKAWALTKPMLLIGVFLLVAAQSAHATTIYSQKDTSGAPIITRGYPLGEFYTTPFPSMVWPSGLTSDAYVIFDASIINSIGLPTWPFISLAANSNGHTGGLYAVTDGPANGYTDCLPQDGANHATSTYGCVLRNSRNITGGTTVYVGWDNPQFNYYGQVVTPADASGNPAMIITSNQPGACNNVVATTTIISSDISSTTTWNAQQAYLISGSISVASGSTLSIQPCSVIKFATATSTLTVNGTLDAEGTSSPIYFTSYKDDAVGGDTNADGTSTSPSSGDWNSLVVGATGSTTLSNVVVGYGGSAGTSSPMIYNNGGKLSIINSTMATSSSYGVGMAGGTVSLASTSLNNNSSGAAFIDLTSGGTFTHATTTDSGNGVNGIVVTGTINADTEWTKDRSASQIPYVPSGVVAVAANKTLTIDPGVIVKFNDATSGLSVSGTVNAQAANNSTIFLTSIYDNETESLATTSPTTAAAGDWKDITVESGGTLALSNAVVRYGGHIATSTSAALLNNTGGTITIDASSTIAYGTTYGIKNTTGTTTVSTSDLAYNNYGLYLTGGSASITASSTIHNNSLYGVYNSTSATTTATGNYWGDNSGPYNALYNPLGTANAVSDKVLFSLFIGSTGTTSQIHYVEAPGTAAVIGGQLTYTTSTTHAQELSAATTTWNSFGPIQILPATTTPNISVSDFYGQDVAETGYYSPTASTSIVALNSYFLNNNTFAQVQNTITHELGHALGLDHSFTGNIMYFNQSSQTTLGSQDTSDYNCLWVSGACPH